MLTQTKEGHSFQKGVPFKWSKSKPVCGISVVKRENRRSENCSDFQFWRTVRGSNPRPRRCERRALPAELTAQIGRFSIKKVMKNGFLRYSILREKSEKSDEKLEGKNGPVMEVHTDANRTLSQLSYAPIGLLCDYKIFFAVCQVFGGGLEKFFFAAPVFMPSACRHRPSFRAWSIPRARRGSALSCCCCCRRRGIPY